MLEKICMREKNAIQRMEGGCDVCDGGANFCLLFEEDKIMTAECLPGRTTRQLANSLRKVMVSYAHGGFLVRHAFMDVEFEKVKELVLFVEVNTTAAREYVGVIKRNIRHAKERVRATTSKFPCILIPVMVLIYIVYVCVF